MSYTDQELIDLLPAIARASEVTLSEEYRRVITTAGERLKSLVSTTAPGESWTCRGCGHANAHKTPVFVTHCEECELLRGAPKPVEHVCGLMGFNGMLDTCPGCEAARVQREVSPPRYAFQGA